jgi:hypothetical protein
MRFVVGLEFCIISLLLLVSCNRQKKNVVVRVYNQALTIEDLQDRIPVFDQQTDSVIIQKQYIDSWIANQVLLHEAEKYLSGKEKRFDKEVADYKQSLLIHAYLNKCVEEMLDRNVTDAEVQHYYNAHKANFKLRQPIIKINYLKFPIASHYIDAARQILFKPNRTEQEWNKLGTTIAKHASNVYLSEDWLLYDDILKEIPIEKEKQSFAKNQTFDITDSTHIYLIKILDFKINEGYSPLNIEKENIIKSILQQRRIKILTSLQENAIKKAKESGEILY